MMDGADQFGGYYQDEGREGDGRVMVVARGGYGDGGRLYELMADGDG
jgi:hypothetical protein